MTTPATNLNPATGGEVLAGYDPTGHNINVLFQAGTPVQDATTGLWYAPLVTTAGATVGDLVATGTLTAAQATEGTAVAGGTVSITLGSGQSVVEAQLTGTWAAGTTIVVDGTDDSGTTTNWFATLFQDTSVANPTNIESIVGGASKIIRIPAAGFTQIRVRASVFNGGDSVSVRMIASTGGGALGGMLATNDGTFAKETGGNLASLVTNTADLLADGDNLATLVTNTADLLADGDNLATINTNTANIPAKGTANMAGSTPVTIATNDTVLSPIAFDNTHEVRVSLYVQKTTAGDTILAVGSATSANSVPVVIASDQGAVQIKRSTVAVYSLASVTTSGATQNSGDLTVGPYTEVSIDINTTAQAGTNPTIQYFYERKAADGIYYVLWQSTVFTAATNTLSTSVGAGMAYNQSLGVTGRIRWVVGGSATPTFTHTINIQGK